MKRFLMVVMLGTAVLFSCSGTAYAASDKKDEQHAKEPKAGHPEKKQPQAQPAQRQPPQARPGPQPPQQAQPRAPQVQRRPPQVQRREPQVQQRVPQMQQRAPQVQQRAPQLQSQRAQPRPKAAGPAPRQQAYHIPQRSQQQTRAWQDKRGWLLRGGWQGHGSWLQDRARNWQVEHRTWEQRGGYGGFYIPEERFILSFGPAHWFRIRTRPVIVAGYPRFWYGGFWFMLVDPWPESWAEDWYATDDVCIEYHDGYYLYDRRHPGIALAVVVVAP